LLSEEKKNLGCSLEPIKPSKGSDSSSRTVQKPEGDKVSGILFSPSVMARHSSLLLLLGLSVLRVAALDCAALKSLQLPNSTITDAVYLTSGTTFIASTDPTCFRPTYNNTVAVCRVTGEVTTSSLSSVKWEAWLPDTWYGRVLTNGNGGLGGCKHLIVVHSVQFRSLILSFIFQVSRTHS
jgi:hypothetical protein